MPYALILAGLILTVAGARNTQGTLYSLLKNDFTGSGSFVWWSVSIVGVGAIGYVKDLRGLANTFLALLLVVLVLNTNKNTGTNAIDNFLNALKNIGNNAMPTATTQPTTQQTTQAANSAPLLNGVNSLLQGAAKLANFGASP